MTRNTDLESTHGQMDASIMGCGKMVNSTEKVSTYCRLGCSDEVAGGTAFAKNGSTLQVQVNSLLLKLQPAQIQVTSNRNNQMTKFEINMSVC